MHAETLANFQYSTLLICESRSYTVNSNREDQGTGMFSWPLMKFQQIHKNNFSKQKTWSRVFFLDKLAVADIPIPLQNSIFHYRVRKILDNIRPLLFLRNFQFRGWTVAFSLQDLAYNKRPHFTHLYFPLTSIFLWKNKKRKCGYSKAHCYYFDWKWTPCIKQKAVSKGQYTFVSTSSLFCLSTHF